MAKQVSPNEYNNPEPQPAQGDELVDPNRFRDLLKIDPSEESGQKKKRQLKREEEEGEDAPPPPVQIAPTGAFQQMMNDKSDDSLLFTIQAPQNAHSILPQKAHPTQVKEMRQPILSQEELMAPYEPSDTSLYIPESATPPPAAPPSQTFTSTERAPDSYAPSRSSPEPTSQTQSDDESQSSSTSNQSSQPAPETPKRGSLPRKKTKGPPKVTKPEPPMRKRDNPIDKIVPTSLDKPIEKEVPIVKPGAAPTIQELIAAEGPPKKAFPPSDLHGKHSGMESYFAEQLKQKKEKGTDQAQNIEGSSGVSSAVGLPTSETTGDRDHQKKDEDPVIAEVGAMPPPQVNGALPEIAPPQAPSYTKLHPHVFELFDRMVAVMTIEQSSDIHTTTVTLNKEGSIFYKSKILIHHHATAPNTFRVELQGSPQAVDLFTANLKNLAAAFQESQLPYLVELEKPVLLEEYRAQTKKKYNRVERKRDS